jgi:hypothetical protein
MTKKRFAKKIYVDVVIYVFRFFADVGYSISCIVGHNGGGFPPLWDTTDKVFLHCGIQLRRFFSIVGYNRRGFPSL